MLLCGLGLAIPGQVGYDGKPGRPGIMWLAGFHGGIDDCGRRELALCMLLSDPLLDFAEDVRHGEVQMVRRCRDDRDLLPIVGGTFARGSPAPVRVGLRPGPSGC